MSQPSSAACLFEDLLHKPVEARFDSVLRTSNAGVMALAKLDRKIGLTERIAAHLGDGRDPARVKHDTATMVRQRVLGIALGFADCNDSRATAHDPALKVACGRHPASDADLASQPTLSRFEHGVSGRAVAEASRVLEDLVIEQLREQHRRPRVLYLDLDPTIDRVHGQQVFAEFHGKYREWCFLPLLAFVSVDRNPEQHLLHARLRPGLSRESRVTPMLLRRLVEKLRKAFPKARIVVRLDAGFGRPQIFDLLDELKVEYLVAIQGNSRLNAIAEDVMVRVRKEAAREQQTVTYFTECRYKTRSWPRERRVIIKAEVVHLPGRLPRDNVRFLVTNMRRTPEGAWSLYCLRGDSENRIKELKAGVQLDRTSCSSFIANQLRVLFSAVAYVLFQQLRRHLHGTELARATVETLRLRLLKIGATVKESVRRVLVSMPTSHPWKDLWCLAARRIAAL